ncbi:MAG TPA: hypothetical protein VNM37_07065, partial [Candidatus Dormibacteraeota bacterium]|nr:hypothetical protein [Candidatus Dormibacteraeota bacterium]
MSSRTRFRLIVSKFDQIAPAGAVEDRVAPVAEAIVLPAALVGVVLIWQPVPAAVPEVRLHEVVRMEALAPAVLTGEVVLLVAADVVGRLVEAARHKVVPPVALRRPARRLICGTSRSRF